MCDYSVNYSPKYSVKRVQQETGIPYYVKPSFDSSRSNVYYVEKDLLGDYYSYYQNRCVNEIQMEKQVRVDFCY